MKQTLTNLLLSLALTASASAQAPSSLPTVDEILDKYIAALGGKPAWEKLTSRVIKGSQEYVGGGTREPIEIYMKAPNKSVTVAKTLDGTYQEGFDGAVGWAKFGEEPVRELSGSELSRAKRNASIYKEVNLRNQYSKMTVKGSEKTGGKEVYVVEAVPVEGEPEKLYFDPVSGLLLRRDFTADSWDGKIEIWAHYEDYREVDGVKLPFTIKQENSDQTIRISEIKHNVAIDDAKFSKPVS